MSRFCRKVRSLEINILRSLWSGRGWPCVGSYRELFGNKYLFSAWLRGLGVPVPRDLELVMLKSQQRVELKGPGSTIESEFEVIGKPVCGNQGRGVHLFKWDDGSVLVDGENLSMPLSKYVEKLCAATGERYGYLFQERVVQNSALSNAFGETLHTVRVITVQTSSGPKVFDALIRVGRSGSQVDNFSAGGLVAHVNPVSWLVDSEFFSKAGGAVECHPDTGARAKGFALPMGEQVKKIVEGLHAYVPTVGAVGWDIGLTPDGPIVVEGNLNMGVEMQSLVYPGDFRREFLTALRGARRSMKAENKWRY